MSFWVYILECSDGSYYVGHTDNMEVRVAQHQTGTFGGYTYFRRPIKVVFSEMLPTRDEAFAAERRIKGWTRAKKEALIARDWNLVSQLGKKKQKH
jgi:predicted GIY-YIG superfamily endonuclease